MYGRAKWGPAAAQLEGIEDGVRVRRFISNELNESRALIHHILDVHRAGDGTCESCKAEQNRLSEMLEHE